jgi:hypothetical protein
MNTKTLQYKAKLPTLPQTGRHLLSWYDENEVLVYIPHIGEYYGDKTVSRPVWITPSFSWMMNHAGWLASPHYEAIECMMIQRFAFEDMLLQAFPADFPNGLFESEDDWKKERAGAMIQYRWQSDYSPDGQELERKILQLGIHSRTWMQYVIKSQVVTYNDIDDALFKQKEHSKPPYDLLVVPDEQAYPIDEAMKKVLGIAD